MNTSEQTSLAPFILHFVETRDLAPGVTVKMVDGAEDCWTEYPESRGIVGSYSDSCSD